LPVATVESPLLADDEFDLDDETLYEIVDGERLELPPMSAYSLIVASRLHFRIGAHALSRSLGEAVMETLFHLGLPVDRNRRPDAAFVSYQRWPKGKPQSWRGNAWDVVPDLAVEVVSPNDFATEILIKLSEYFRAGVRLVWVVYPNLRIIHVYSSFTTIHVLTQSDALDGGEVLPGLKLPLAELFTEELIDPQTSSSEG